MRTSCRLPTGLALFAVAILALPSRAADAEKYLPNNSDGVIIVNVRALLDSQIGSKVLELAKPNLNKNDAAQKMLDALGIDPFKDVERVVVGAPGGNDLDKAVFVIQGKFDPAKIQAVAAKAAESNADNLKIEKIGGVNLFEITPPGKGQKVSYAALLDENVLVGSVTRDAVVDAIEKKAGKRKPELKKALTELLDKVDTKQAISIAALDSGQGEFAGQVKSVTGGLTITDQMKLDVVLTAKDEKTAAAVLDKVKEGLEQVKQIASLFANNDWLAPLADVAATLEAKQDGAGVRVTGEVSKAIVEKVEKTLKGLKPKNKDKE